MEGIEEPYKAVILTSFDWGKAFNRSDHRDVLQSFRRLDTPDWIMRIIASFLSQRKMCVKVGETMSDERDMPGGSPQGCRLGGLIYEVFSDSFGHEFPDDVYMQKYVDDTSAIEEID